MPVEARVSWLFDLLERLADLSDEELGDLCLLVNGVAMACRRKP
jgi:hypothetical protein